MDSDIILNKPDLNRGPTWECRGMVLWLPGTWVLPCT